MNLGDEYQNFLIFIALLITGDEGEPLIVPTLDLSLATKMGDGAYLHGGNQASTHYKSVFSLCNPWKHQKPQEGLNCESLAYEVVT